MNKNTNELNDYMRNRVAEYKERGSNTIDNMDALAKEMLESFDSKEELAKFTVSLLGSLREAENVIVSAKECLEEMRALVFGSEDGEKDLASRTEGLGAKRGRASSKNREHSKKGHEPNTTRRASTRRNTSKEA